MHRNGKLEEGSAGIGMVYVSGLDFSYYHLFSQQGVFRFTTYYTGFYGDDKILYKNLDLTQDFPNKILSHFLREQNLPKIFRWPGMCSLGEILAQDFQMAAVGCHENLDAARKSIAPLLFLGDKQKTLETQNAHGDHDAATAKAAAAVTHVQNLSQEVGSGDEGLGLFGFDLSSAETNFW